MKAAMERDRKVRVGGNINLLTALRDAGVRRYLLQSSAFWYSPGAGLADKFVPFISSASRGVEASAGTYLELEARAEFDIRRMQRRCVFATPAVPAWKRQIEETLYLVDLPR
jgi:hypothetical protein